MTGLVMESRPSAEANRISVLGGGRRVIDNFTLNLMNLD